MSKRMFLLRHGQALHNPRAEKALAAGCSHATFMEIMKEDDSLDADLTPLGRRQAEAACEAIAGGSPSLGIELLVASSLSRAVETAMLAFPEAAAAGRTRFLALESLRERNGWMQCAKRRTRAELTALFPCCSFAHLQTEEDASWTPELETEEACAERGYQALAWLMSRPESTLAVVAHGGIFKLAFGAHPKVFADEAVAVRFGNGEIKACTMRWLSEPDGTIQLQADPAVRPSKLSTS